MASAGRILIMPKGNWSAETEYEMLDLVKHNGKTWLAKKTSVGIEPSVVNSEFWQDVFDVPDGKFDGDVIIQIVNNGKTIIRKNHSEKGDYGTELIDYDVDGNVTKLVVKSKNTLENKVGFVYEEEFYSFFGEHNCISKTYSGTTDANGFLKPKDIAVDTTDILSCKISSGSGFCTPFNDTDAHWSFKFENGDRTPIANKSVTVKIIYRTV